MDATVKLVGLGFSGITAFCERHRLQMSLRCACEIGAALAAEKGYEWVLPTETDGMTRICFGSLSQQDFGPTVALVFKGTDVELERTTELNRMIFVGTSRRWLPKK